ncbi:hypothetical protein FSJ43_012510 [Escherichia coli]|uniref:hypothetical protein n=1 Tax=Escherichia coli TaxID=562 RepID=UPI0017DC6572|nr:hypothetical protein [Escherichia coli]EIQ6789904.1 hypothetical protein [Escherichia coli]MBC0214433.1 hypothetical protein [Escherichia coli]WCQ64942.1 hypothetical protein NL408_012330 [Escherichia coli]HAH2533833.1 hypothetical protein [Escherichia coli]HCQ1780070.1 hypothetical protein [Escherichia coli]
MKNIIKVVLIGVMALALTGCARSTDFVKLADKKLQVGMTCEQVNKIMGEPQRIEYDGNYSYHVWYSVTSTIGFTYMDVEELSPSRVIAKFDNCILKEWKDRSKAKSVYNTITHSSPGTAIKDFN